jgi:hypothetical protein
MRLKVRFIPNAVSAFVSLVLLANWLMPAIAGATVKRDKFSALFSVICTSSGVKIVDVGGLKANQSAPTHNLQDTVHCPLCVVGGSPVLLCTTLSLAMSFAERVVFNHAVACFAPIQTLWPNASPRGPPVIA